MGPGSAGVGVRYSLTGSMAGSMWSWVLFSLLAALVLAEAVNWSGEPEHGDPAVTSAWA